MTLSTRISGGVATVLAICGGICPPLWGQSAWLPAERTLLATPGFVYSAFDEFWVGETTVGPLKANDEYLEQYAAFLAFEYGLAEAFALDLTVGYTWTSSTTTFGDGDEGLMDTTFGLRFQLCEETPEWPAVALRVGGTIAGTYDENTPFSAGDGADGAEASILMGKRFGDSGFGFYGDFGFRYRNNSVPDELFGSLGLLAQFPSLVTSDDALTLTLGYRHVESLSGLDIMGAGFDPSLGSSHGFPALREINQLLQGSVGYADQGGRQYQLVVAKSLAGRNTGDKLILGFSMSFLF